MQVFIGQYVGSLVSNSRLVDFKSFGRLRATKGGERKEKKLSAAEGLKILLCATRVDLQKTVQQNFQENNSSTIASDLRLGRGSLSLRGG